jgi:hypothetical protein
MPNLYKGKEQVICAQAKTVNNYKQVHPGSNSLAYWLIVNHHNLYIVYNRHGQSAARGPHAALQPFFAAPESFLWWKFFSIVLLLFQEF